MDSSTTSRFWLHEWRVDPTLGRITRGQESVQLASQQVQVLLLLSRNPKLTLSHREIEATACGDLTPTVSATGAGDAAQRCISQLRAALRDDARQPRFIQTVPRRGYRLIAPIRNECTTDLDRHADSPKAADDARARGFWPTCQRASHACLRAVSRVGQAAFGPFAVSRPGSSSAGLPRIGLGRIGLGRIELARVGLARTCASAVLLLTLGTLWWGTEREQAASDSANAVQLSQFMENVFASSDAQTTPGQPDTAQVLLGRALRRLDADLKDQPRVRMQMLETIARAYVHQHQGAAAVPALEEALRIRRDLGNAPPPETAATLTTLGEALQSMNRFQEARHTYREALDILRVTHYEPSRDFAATFGRLGTLDVAQGRFTQGLATLDASLLQMRETQGLYHTDTAGVLVDISHACQCMGNLTRADQALQEAQRIYRSSTAQMSPDRLTADNAAGQILLAQQRFDEASLVLERTLAARRQLYGLRGVAIAETLNLLASVRNGQGRLEEAEELKLAAIDALGELGDSAKLQRATVQLSLATLLMRTQQFARSEALLRESIDIYTATLPADHLSRISAEHYLGEALLEQKKYREAESTLQTALERMRRAAVPQWRIARSQSTLGEALYRQGKIDLAKPLLLQSHAQLAADPLAKQIARDKAQQRVTTLLGKQMLWASTVHQR